MEITTKRRLGFAVNVGTLVCLLVTFALIWRATHDSGAPTKLASRKVTMELASGWYALGRPDAPITVVEFMDLQCPFCRQFQTTTFAQLKKDYVDSGKVRFIAMDLPLPMHQYAMGAAEAEHCAGDQGKFWQFRDAVLDEQAPPSPDALLKHVKELQLDRKEFDVCVSADKYKRIVENQQNSAEKMDIRGTPSFVIGRADDEKIKGVLISGMQPLASFEQAIRSAMNER